MTPLWPSESWWTSEPLQHPGDDLHVPVRVGLEAGAGLDDVVVVDQQQAVVGVGRVVVVAEGERVLGVQPAKLLLNRSRRGGRRRSGRGQVLMVAVLEARQIGAGQAEWSGDSGADRLRGAGRGRGAGTAVRGQAVLMAETSNSRVTLSLTSTPPVSSAAFQVTP